MNNKYKEILNKFEDLWEDRIEEDKDLELITLSEIQEFNLTWHETWIDFLSQNELFEELAEDEQDKLKDFNIVKYLFK